jgi:hypothetical protein
MPKLNAVFKFILHPMKGGYFFVDPSIEPDENNRWLCGR